MFLKYINMSNFTLNKKTSGSPEKQASRWD